MLSRLLDPLGRSLAGRAHQPREGKVFVRGGWVDRVSSVPTDGGVEQVVRFAEACWMANIRLQRELMAIETPQPPHSRGASADAETH